MTSGVDPRLCAELRDALLYARTVVRMFEKLLDDVFEAYHRTPYVVSSRPYIERGLRLSEAGVTAARILAGKLEALNREHCAPKRHRVNNRGAEGAAERQGAQGGGSEASVL